MRRRVRETWTRLVGGGERPEHVDRFWEDRRARQPGFRLAVVEDARTALARRGDTRPFETPLQRTVQIARLAVVTDAFLAQVCYRAKVASQRRGIPVLPHLLHRAAVVTGQIAIGDPVVLEPGVYIPHGQVVADGLTEVGRGVTLSPFTTLGLVIGGVGGPTIGPMATIGTGAKVLGPVEVGPRAQVGANAVVLRDVPPGATAVGVPAQVRGGPDDRREGGGKRGFGPGPEAGQNAIGR